MMHKAWINLRSSLLASHFGALVLLAIAVIPLMAYIRFAPHKPEHWHIDPEEAPRRGKPNRLLLTGPEALIVPASVEDTAHMIKDIALATPRTRLLAGSAEEGWMTFLTTSTVLKYPDYTSFRISEAETGGSRVSVFARARFGYRDFGMNRRRVDGWIASLSQRVPGEIGLSMEL